MHRFAGPVRVIELLAMFDETHPSINSRPSFEVPSFLLVSVCRPSLRHMHEMFELVDMLCPFNCHTGAIHVCTHV